MMSIVTQAPFALWITGLPASGKSSIVAQLIPKLRAISLQAEVMESDAVRRILTPSPTYSTEERELFYRSLAFMGSRLLAHGVNVIFDATASRRAYREFARTLMPQLLEVSVECPLEVCMQRDKKEPTGADWKASLRRCRGCKNLTKRRSRRIWPSIQCSSRRRKQRTRFSH